MNKIQKKTHFNVLIYTFATPYKFATKNKSEELNQN
jgi:hypothetical protein